MVEPGETKVKAKSWRKEISGKI